MLRIFSIIFCLLLASCGGDKGKAPKATKLLHETKLANGEVLQDYYHWMRDANWPKEVSDKKILDHLNAENKYLDDYFADQKENKEKLFEEMKGRIKLADISAPIKRDNYFYYTRTEEDKSYPIYCRKEGSMDSEEEILLNVNELSKGHEYTQLGSFSVSEDHNLLAYSVDFSGGEKYEIKVLDLRTREYLPDHIENVIGSIIWHKEKHGFFYLPRSEDMRIHNVKYHELGTEVNHDKIIYHEKDQKFSVGIGKSSSREYLLIYAGTASECEYRILPLKSDEMKPILIQERMPNVIYSIEHNGNFIYKLTNEFGSNMSISRVALNDIQDNIWRTYIPVDDKKYLESFDVTEDHMMLNYKVSGLPLIKILHIKDAIARIVKFPDEAYTAYAYTTNYEEDDLRIDYSSLNRASIVYKYDFDHGKLEVLKEKEVLGGYNPDDYEVKRLMANNGDIMIPISLIYRRDMFKDDGSNPLLLYGYGSYGIAVPPSFRTQYVSLLDRGFVFAIAHIRGGDDLGYSWYESAKLLSKKNTFEDFIACAKHLVDEKYTIKGNITISGGSAGGMLVGAAMNMEPELFKAVIASSPSVDVLTNMLDKDLLGTPFHYTELGNPEDKEYFDYIKSYSPYHNISKKYYPYVYADIGISDPRVPYYSAAKWVAKLRAHSKSGNPVFLRVNMGSGHFGASDRFEWLKEYAEQFVFVLDAYGKRAF